MKLLLILLCAIPILLALVAANLMGFSRVRKAGDVSVNLETLLDNLSERYSKIQFEFKKRAWSGIPLNSKGITLIDEKYRHSTSISVIARQLVKLGLSGLWEENQKLVRWRMRCVKMGYIIPPLVLIGCILATVVGRMPAMWIVIILGLVLSANICFLWSSRSVEKEAAARMISLLERSRALPRLSEEERLIEAIHGWTWISTLPGIAISCMDKNTKNR